jgi:hypothetical protein
MADISFRPSFTNVDFVDGTDRVRADEPNGFNARFNAIESDLHQLSTVVAQVDGILNPGAKVLRLTVPPTLLALDADWVGGITGAVSAKPGQAASGVLLLNLPAGSHLLSFRALGQARGGSATLSLARVPIAGGAAQPLASVTGDTDPFDKSKPIDSSVALVAIGTFRYLVQATTPVLPADAAVTLAAFQIAYSLT